MLTSQEERIIAWCLSNGVTITPDTRSKYNDGTDQWEEVGTFSLIFESDKASPDTSITTVGEGDTIYQAYATLVARMQCIVKMYNKILEEMP